MPVSFSNSGPADREMLDRLGRIEEKLGIEKPKPKPKDPKRYVVCRNQAADVLHLMTWEKAARLKDLEIIGDVDDIDILALTFEDYPPPERARTPELDPIQEAIQEHERGIPFTMLASTGMALRDNNQESHEPRTIVDLSSLKWALPVAIKKNHEEQVGIADRVWIEGGNLFASGYLLSESSQAQSIVEAAIHGERLAASIRYRGFESIEYRGGVIGDVWATVNGRTFAEKTRVIVGSNLVEISIVHGLAAVDGATWTEIG